MRHVRIFSFPNGRDATRRSLEATRMVIDIYLLTHSSGARRILQLNYEDHWNFFSFGSSPLNITSKNLVKLWEVGTTMVFDKVLYKNFQGKEVENKTIHTLSTELFSSPIFLRDTRVGGMNDESQFYLRLAQPNMKIYKAQVGQRRPTRAQISLQIFALSPSTKYQMGRSPINYICKPIFLFW